MRSPEKWSSPRGDSIAQAYEMTVRAARAPRTRPRQCTPRRLAGWVQVGAVPSASGGVVRGDERDRHEGQRDRAGCRAGIGGQRAVLETAVVTADPDISQDDGGETGRHGEHVADDRDQGAEQRDQAEGEGEVP